MAILRFGCRLCATLIHLTFKSLIELQLHPLPYSDYGFWLFSSGLLSQEMELDRTTPPSRLSV